ncbi:MAG: hypothetical protein ACI9B8_001439 [Sulfitobacter sp.]
MIDQCPCCKRGLALTFHHLIPKKMHRRDRFKKHFSKQELNRGVYICRQCHVGIHKAYDQMTLAKYFAEFSFILEDEDLQRHFHWVGKQKVTSIGI